jgi:hypothetical protein
MVASSSGMSNAPRYTPPNALGNKQAVPSIDMSQPATMAQKQEAVERAFKAIDTYEIKPEYIHSDPNNVVQASSLGSNSVGQNLATLRVSLLTMEPEKLDAYLNKIADPNTPLAESKKMARLFDAPIDAHTAQQKLDARTAQWQGKAAEFKPQPVSPDMVDLQKTGQAALNTRTLDGIAQQTSPILAKQSEYVALVKANALPEQITAAKTAADTQLRQSFASGGMPKTDTGIPLYQVWDEATQTKHATVKMTEALHQARQASGEALSTAEKVELTKLKSDLAKNHYTPEYRSVVQKQAEHAHLTKKHEPLLQAQADKLKQQEHLLNERRRLNNELTKSWPWEKDKGREALRTELNQVKADEAKLKTELKATAKSPEMVTLRETAKAANVPGSNPSIGRRILDARQHFDDWATETVQANHQRALTSRNPLVKYPAKASAGFSKLLGWVVNGAVSISEKVIPGSGKYIMKGLSSLGPAMLAWEGGRAVYNISQGNYKHAAMDLTGLATGAAALWPIMGLLAAAGTGGLGMFVIPAVVGGLGAWAGRETIGNAIVNTFGLTNKEDRDEAKLDAIAQKMGIDRNAVLTGQDGKPITADAKTQEKALAQVQNRTAPNAFAVS